MITAIYGCWKGHPSKKDAPSREEILQEIPCEKCGETAILYDVMAAAPPKLKLTVVKGGLQ